MPKKIPYEEFVSIFSKVPRICVDIVIKKKEGILLTKRAIKPWKGEWHLPGGGILFGESFNQAIKRVALEELNLNVEPIKCLGVIEFLDKLDSKIHAISIVFLVKEVSGKIKLNNQAEKFIFSKEFPENTVLEHRLFLEKKREDINKNF